MNEIKAYWKYAILLLLIFSIAASLFHPFKKSVDTYKFATMLNKVTMNQLIEGLEKEKISNFFTMNGMGQYQIMFYGEGKINARYLLEKDRMQNRINQVAVAFKNKEKTAFVLLKPQDRKHFKQTQMKHLSETVTLVINPTVFQLKSFGFETSDLN